MSYDLRFIRTQWFLGQKITGGLIGPCPAPAAKPDVFAFATLSFVG